MPTPRAQDKHEIFFNFSAPFEIHDDNEIMKRMRLHECHTQSQLESLVPPHLRAPGVCDEDGDDAAATQGDNPYAKPAPAKRATANLFKSMDSTNPDLGYLQQ